MKFNSFGIDVRRYVMRLTCRTDAGPVVKAPDQAPHIRLETAIALEVLVGSAHALPLRLFAGAVCLMIQGVWRWSDIQHCCDLVHNHEAIIASSYSSKNKRRKLRWACLRKGFGKLEWGVDFAVACEEANAPGPDYPYVGL